MSYKRVIMFNVTEVTNQTVEATKTKYFPAIKAMGAIEADLVQTGPNSTVLVVTYPDKATAVAAAEKAVALRAQSQKDFGGDTPGPEVLEGEVLASM